MRVCGHAQVSVTMDILSSYKYWTTGTTCTTFAQASLPSLLKFVPWINISLSLPLRQFKMGGLCSNMQGKGTGTCTGVSEIAFDRRAIGRSYLWPSSLCRNGHQSNPFARSIGKWEIGRCHRSNPTDLVFDVG